MKRKNGVTTCKKCEVKLVVGENIAPSRFKQSNYWCSKCYYKHKTKASNEKLYNRVQRKQYYDIYETQIPAGIYGIYYKDELWYIGESKRPRRRVNGHFSKSNWNISPTATMLYNNEIERKYLSFKMFEFIDDTVSRKQREMELIQEYNPPLNTDHTQRKFK